MPIINELLHKSTIYIKEEIYEQYKPKLIKYVRLHANYSSENSLESLLTELSRAKKQRDVVLSYFQLETSKKPIKVKELETDSRASSAIIKALVDKDILEYYLIQTDRISYDGNTNDLKELNEFQEQALQEIKTSFKTKEVTLLH